MISLTARLPRKNTVPSSPSPSFLRNICEGKRKKGLNTSCLKFCIIKDAGASPLYDLRYLRQWRSNLFVRRDGGVVNAHAWNLCCWCPLGGDHLEFRYRKRVVERPPEFELAFGRSFFFEGCGCLSPGAFCLRFQKDFWEKERVDLSIKETLKERVRRVH